jgi:hypothetical protein
MYTTLSSAYDELCTAHHDMGVCCVPSCFHRSCMYSATTGRKRVDAWEEGDAHISIVHNVVLELNTTFTGDSMRVCTGHC